MPGRPFMDHYLPSLLTPDALSRRRPAAGRGVHLGLVAAEPHARRRRHLQRLPRSAHAEAARARQCGLRAVPRCPRSTTRLRIIVTSRARPARNAPTATCRSNTYMVVDPRRDHSMRVPRPDESVALGVPNACNGCHADRDAKWAAAAVRGWLGRDAAGFQTFAAAFHAAETGEPAALESLARHCRQTAAQPPHRARVGPCAPGRQWPVHARFRAAHGTGPEPAGASGDRAARRRDAAGNPVRWSLGPLLGDATRAVRIEAARSLGGRHRTRCRRTCSQHGSGPRRNTSQRCGTPRIARKSRVALGGFQAALGEPDEAQSLFSDALRLDPEFVPAYVNAADVLRAQGRDQEAADMLQQGLARVPMSATLASRAGPRAHSPAAVRPCDGLAQAGRRTRPGRRALRLCLCELRCIRLATSTNRSAACRTQRAAGPTSRDVLMALTSFQLEAGRKRDAQVTARRLVARIRRIRRCACSRRRRWASGETP